MTQISTLWSFQCSSFFRSSPALSELLYYIAYQGVCQELFFNILKQLSVHFHASQCFVYDVVFALACLPDSLIILPKIRPLVNAFFYLFFSFFILLFLPLIPCALQPFFVSFTADFSPYKSAIFICALIATLVSPNTYTSIRSLFYLLI